VVLDEGAAAPTAEPQSGPRQGSVHGGLS
jgi:hypothetical protein